MQTYLVGGAVRDQLLNRKVIEKDWVIVGATPSQMLSQGYLQVGKDFPVFLHPKTKDEYALARTERKSAKGYTGFECDTSIDVTLEQDLIRRDLTVNAMAMDDNGTIIDPYNGQVDLENRVLRHVSDAFVEDPLRVLRVARFAARYHHLGFTIAPETMALMQEIVSQKELDHLTAERVWKETERSLLEDNPEVYFETLRECGALQVWFPELDNLWGVPNPEKWHPEIDTGVHTMMVLAQSTSLSKNLAVRFSSLVHDLGKALTPTDKWPAHHGHEKLGLDAINRLCDRLKAPNDCRQLALITCEFHGHVHKAFELEANTIINMFNRTDAWRKPERFHDFLSACEADARGRKHFETIKYEQRDYIWNAYQHAKAVDVKGIIAKGIKGSDIKKALDEHRIEVISNIKQKFLQQSS